MSDVDQELPVTAFQTGIEQFNQGEYYACHDTLEAIWMTALAADKAFYQGILQIAVALYHLGNHNWHGAAILLGEGLKRLQPYEPSYQGVDVVALVDCGFAWLGALQALGPAQVGAIAAAVRPGSEIIEVGGLNLTLPALYILPASSEVAD
jgi:uncharacterized protein